VRRDRAIEFVDLSRVRHLFIAQLNTNDVVIFSLLFFCMIMTFLRYNLVFSILIETHSLVKKKRRYNSICNPTYRIPFVLPMITITLLCL
jgi:hypothetical protein